MQVFKCAMRIVFRNPWLLLVYAVGLGFMGVAMGSGFDFEGDTAQYERPSIDYAIIDRDGGEVVGGIDEFLAGQGARIHVEDSEAPMQDAVAKGEVGYMLVVPEGYSEAFLQAAADGAKLPGMQVVYSYSSPDGAVVDAALANYLSELATCLAASGGDVSSAKASALAAARETADVTVVGSGDYKLLSDQFCFYLQFDIYVLFAAIVACLGTLLATLNQTDIRRRNLSSPIGYIARNAQVALACLVITTIVWAWVFGLGAVCFPASFGSIEPAGVALMAVIVFVFALIPLSVAFLMGQAGASMVASNAIGNIAGLVVSFLGGAWIPLDIAGPEISAVAHFLPGYWYTDALSQAAHLGGQSGSTKSILAAVGILLMFAVAIFLAGLIVGRLSVQTSESGGNSTASSAVYGTS